MLKSLYSNISNTPLLVDASQMEWFAAAFKADAVELNKIAASDSFWSSDYSWYRPYKVDNQGNLHIPVAGSLLNHFPFAYGRYATGYDYIYEALKRGLGDSDVKAIILNVDSPGGMVDGCFELCDYIYNSRSIKPIVAVCDSRAYSAAYAIASSASRLYVPQTGGVGSVGVVTAHVDMSKMYENWGIKVTYIFAGKHKVDGNPHEPLPEPVKARIQASIDETYTLFVNTVARNRDITEAVVRETEATCLSPKEAKAIGFVDEIKYPSEARATFATDYDDVEDGEDTMTTKPNDQGASTPAVDEKAVHAAAFAEGVQAERTRISAILNAPESEGRGTMANHLAFETDMGSEAAVKLLKVAPAESAPKAENTDNAFNRAMESNNPEVSGETQESAEVDEWDAARAKVTGIVKK